jgi:hypothetical protein
MVEGREQRPEPDASREVETARAQYVEKKKGGGQIDGRHQTVTGQSPRVYYRRERVGDPWVMSMK